jgi:hypothetical protein
VQPRELQLVAGGGVDQARRPGGPEDAPRRRYGDLPAGRGDVADCGAVEQRLLRQRAGGRQAQRLEQPLAQHRVPRRVAQHLHQRPRTV